MRTNLKQMKISDPFMKHSVLRIDTERMQHEMNKLEKELIRRFCPYTKDMKVLYKFGDARDLANGESRHGIIKKIFFNPGNGVDGVWEICLRPCNSKFKPYDSVRSEVWLSYINCKIIKIIKKAP